MVLWNDEHHWSLEIVPAGGERQRLIEHAMAGW